ncbi:UDP-N-acetylmuramoylalanine--D-glutamate ligase [hydrothermal vent metagenome]|uniref:UDP-N-acetylmuramoylalanine--D-glutamate ligase n=1 Tax=hydrothermal vent metagenome TaxID=652676 RepID=A0A3B1D3I5_9ZZZZ
MTIDFVNKKALVIGLARTGVSAAKLLSKLGAIVTVTDMKNENALKDFSSSLPDGVKKMLGGHDGVSVSDYDLAVISPGVPWDAPLPASMRKAGVELVSEVEFAVRLIKKPLIAVTGSNGKSTTTTLIGLMLKAAGKKVYVGGNIGAPLCDAVDGDYDWIVAEISSFQLEGIKTFKPRIGLILNITEDHLDRHKTVNAYVALKARVFENMDSGDTLIVNGDDAKTRTLDLPAGVKVLKFTHAHSSSSCAWIENGKAVAQVGDIRVELFALDDLKIPGAHNVENAISAGLTALSAGVTPNIIQNVIRSFEGLPHRMELVATIDNVNYINDSKGTNIDATLKSIEGFNKNLVLIAGGSNKGADFSPLAKAIVKHAKGIVLIGETAQAIKQELGSFEHIEMASSMEKAVIKASAFAKQGDTVLLSPACASFDMFKNFEDRGDAFKKSVGNLTGAIKDAC